MGKVPVGSVFCRDCRRPTAEVHLRSCRRLGNPRPLLVCRPTAAPDKPRWTESTMIHNLAYYLKLKNMLLIAVFVASLYLFTVIFMMNSISNVSSNISTRRQESLVFKYTQSILKNNGSLQPFISTSLRKIDWHNYEQIAFDLKKKGIGEQGKPATLPESEAEAAKKIFDVNGFNGLLSDKISLTRAIPDIRHAGCKKKLYIMSLPTVSVVVPFFEEHWSTLLRTASSVLYRSPPHLIKEIILVDDGSNKPFLKKPLDKYLSKNLPKVHVIHLDKRGGLIGARLAGAKRATGDVLLFLDSHVEANVNWLPPLLEPIAENYRTVVCPFIDVIDDTTLEYTAQDNGGRGAFDWHFDYKRLEVLPKDEANMPEPFESPVMAGGLFAISRAFFWELGGYDPGLAIWGGEQYELSFKIWQCGGRMIDAPCSRVGHIYRGSAPEFPKAQDHGTFVAKNFRRVAEVWMDEYAQYLYARHPEYLEVDPGNLTEQKELRRRLHCKPFRWFMTQIAFDLIAKYPPVDPKPFAEGRIRPSAASQLCVAANGDSLHLQDCKGSREAEQDWILTHYRDVSLKAARSCWDLVAGVPEKNGSQSKTRKSISLQSCHTYGGNQLWRYFPESKAFKFGDGDACLDWETSSQALFVASCQETETQRWLLDTLNEEALSKWGETTERVTGPVEHWEPTRILNESVLATQSRELHEPN